LGLAIHHFKEAEARAEEAQDAMAIVEDEATESMAEAEKQLRERLSANSNEMVAAGGEKGLGGGEEPSLRVGEEGYGLLQGIRGVPM
ncbi:unnamed protein product, partial [Musa hybrid cultivar]